MSRRQPRGADPARRRLLAGLAALAPLAAGGCGFQRQGTYAALPFERFHTPIPANSAIGADLRRAIRASGAQVVDQPNAAQVVLMLLSQREEREISAFSTTGRPREYVLRLRTRFRIADSAGRDLTPHDEILLRRRLTASDALGTFNPDEDALLFRDMRSDLVQQLMRRLTAVKLPA